MPQPTADERFDAKWQLDPIIGCWLWTAYTNTGGYGRFGVGGKTATAHRWAYERARGAIPEGLQIDHLCRMRRCVNPAHLEAVQQAENIRRGLLGDPSTHHNSTKTECPEGHPYDEGNTYRRPDGGRDCRTCKRASDRRHYRAQKRQAS